MTIRANRYYGATGTTSGYNSPEIGQAASSLGKMFSGIPEAADVRNAAEAKATTEKASRLAYLFANPNASDFDRQAIAAGLQTGTSSLYAVDQNNATSRANTAASNVTTLEQEKLRGQNSLSQLYATPQTAKEGETVYLPHQFQAASGLGPTLSGGIKLNQGQDYTAPDGSTITGPAKPLSESDMKARILGGLAPSDQRAAVLSSVGVTPVQGTNGPEYVNTSDAAGRPVQSPDVSSRVTNYGTPDGKKGTAVPDRDGVLHDTQTGERLPAQAQVFNSQAAGTPDQLGGKSTEAQDRYAMALKMTDEPTRIIDDAFSTGKLPTGGDDAIRALSNVAPGAVGTFIAQQMSPEAQSFHNAIKNAVPYQLLALSGQGVTEAEYERTMARMVPFANDTPEVRAQKRNQFNAFREAIRGLAGPAAAKVGMGAPAAQAPAAGPAAPDPGQTTMPSLSAPVPAAQQGQQAAAAGAQPTVGAGEGTIIENDAGQRMVRRGGKWEPL